MTLTNIYTKRSIEAAETWLAKLSELTDTRRRRQRKELAELAFALYELDWGRRSHDIRTWNWPHLALAGEDNFLDSQPWTVLLRECVTM